MLPDQNENAESGTQEHSGAKLRNYGLRTQENKVNCDKFACVEHGSIVALALACSTAQRAIVYSPITG
jgi:hypothetical protein